MPVRHRKSGNSPCKHRSPEAFSAAEHATQICHQVSIGFHFINFGEVCDDYRPLSSLPGWPIRDEGRYVGQIGGWGELVWIANGRVVHIQTALDFSDASELVAFTRAVISVDKDGEALVATGRQW
ncbi:hypothetical protein RBSH_02096 [Rhodopirellula baltica SH28]|uniref:Uncharacterized protein n=1 Tax=Rhodopirellula baltica SH28 TaxID=993517 RepID=K5D6V0_RHOBT|nr:hypothetical protein RBSH_02096 [Rhodopirellula baltica SH28]